MNEEVKHFVVQRRRDRRIEEIQEALAVEEPLEIRLNDIPLAVVMRTPGHDFDLARGFLLTEGILQGANGERQKIKGAAQSAEEFSSSPLATCNLLVEHARDELGLEIPNVINCRLPSISEKEISGWQRHIFASSSCGICGRASIDRVRLQAPPPSSRWQISFQILQTLPDKLRQSQTAFARTGGLHAAAFFTPAGEIIAVREDIGRHNAVDKILGWAMRQNELSLENFGLLVSGRLSFELVQKALIGGIAFMAGISAASSLAVELAQETGLTLAGFLRGDTAVVYSNPQRILLEN
ncbi:MAG: formate dehydrogenase accessory sulfurtransferase FdhD [candidate division KSB1 bacterium]|nr:formate dehydrogenase accessory sulfurtransferase FdhD [candidate division KSB1 bacterium]MDZ7368052.1 formate dehydrogenase accessory sulfurtransferase FdhD [candidate division KSB1 bacterium]MDZ7405722.1 formate dehydrogenase accessory sulfurtransferase FdhD [candidate division KSB1 bacterium]